MPPNDRTLLAALGFQDKDKNQLHDLCCMYLVSEEGQMQIFKLIDAEMLAPKRNQVLACKEVPLYKRGSNFVIGFADVVITYVNRHLHKIIIEVKTKEPLPGELIRQLHLYRGDASFPPTTLVCVTPFEPSKFFVESLKQSNIRILNIKDQLRPWCIQKGLLVDNGEKPTEQVP